MASNLLSLATKYFTTENIDKASNIAKGASQFAGTLRGGGKITLSKGALPGYSLTLPRAVRRKALVKEAKKQGHVKIIRKLNVLYIFNKNNYPEKAAKFRRDMKFVQQMRLINSPSKSKAKRSKAKSPKGKAKRSKAKSPKPKAKRSKAKSPKPKSKRSKAKSPKGKAKRSKQTISLRKRDKDIKNTDVSKFSALSVEDLKKIVVSKYRKLERLSGRSMDIGAIKEDVKTASKRKLLNDIKVLIYAFKQWGFKW